MKKCGYISIDRSNKQSAFCSLKKAAKTLINGTSILIFPEGRRNINDKILTLKKGGIILSIKTNVPIIIKNSRKAMT